MHMMESYTRSVPALLGSCQIGIPHNISFLGNIGGLTKLTNYGVWPFYLIANEILPSERFVKCRKTVV